MYYVNCHTCITFCFQNHQENSGQPCTVSFAFSVLPFLIVGELIISMKLFKIDLFYTLLRTTCLNDSLSMYMSQGWQVFAISVLTMVFSMVLTVLVKIMFTMDIWIVDLVAWTVLLLCKGHPWDGLNCPYWGCSLVRSSVISKYRFWSDIMVSTTEECPFVHYSGGALYTANMNES